MATKIKIKKGDNVRVIAGSHKGTEGNVLSVSRETNKAIVEGVNLVKKHNKPNAQNPQEITIACLNGCKPLWW